MRRERDNEELSELLDSIDIETWLDQNGVIYKKARGARGPQANIKECPVCGNSHWKVYINLDNGLGNCFSGDCEKKFNKFSFIRASLGDIGVPATIERIRQSAKEQGWRPPKLISAPVQANSDLKLPESVALPIVGRNLKYLENRSITPEITRYFGLRYSANGKFNYTSEGRNLSQSYAKRIIIPIFDLEGKLCSFQGRDITGEADKKYLFPPGFAATGSILYNGHNFGNSSQVVIGEGVFDVMAIKMALDTQMELRDVVPLGSFGKHLSFGDDQSQMAKLMLLKERGLKQVTIMWDGEPAALEAAADTALKISGYGIKTRVAILPAGRDPNEVTAAVVVDAFWKAVGATTLTMARLKMQIGRMK